MDVFTKRDRKDLEFGLMQTIIMLSLRLAFNSRTINNILNISIGEKPKNNENEEFKNILSSILFENELKEFNERLENNNIIKEEHYVNNNENTKKSILNMLKSKFFNL